MNKQVSYDDFLGMVRESRSIRRFDESKPVGDDVLRCLVDVARFAPTGNNTQLLRFHLVSEQQEVATCFSHHHWAALLKEWDGPAAGERPTAYIVICAPTGLGKQAIRNIDAGIAAQTILLAARTLGLGGCMIKSFDQGLNEDLGLTEAGYECLLLLALGVPVEKVLLEADNTVHGLHYWHDADNANHVPKLSLDELLI